MKKIISSVFIASILFSSYLFAGIPESVKSIKEGQKATASETVSEMVNL